MTLRPGLWRAENRTHRRSISRTVRAAAMAGLVARGVVYGVMGWLAIDVARGNYGGQLNQKGALAQVAARRDGQVLLAVLAAGLAGYVLWGLAQAVWGSPASGRSVGGRLRSVCQALFYGLLCYTAIAILVGSPGKGQAQQQESATARLMRHVAGRWLIGVIGSVVVIVGVVMFIEGVRRRFLKELETADMGSDARRVVTALGTFGGAARGVVVAVAGGLVIDAAITADPAKSTGLDGALRSLAQNSAGPWLLGLAALGLIAFGLFSVVSARWVRV